MGNRNRTIELSTVSVRGAHCPLLLWGGIFAYLGLRSIRLLCEQVKIGEHGVQAKYLHLIFSRVRFFHVCQHTIYDAITYAVLIACLEETFTFQLVTDK